MFTPCCNTPEPIIASTKLRSNSLSSLVDVPHSQDCGSQAGPSRTGRNTRGEWRLPSLAGDSQDGMCSPAVRAPRPPPLPGGATFGQVYELMLVVDSREQVTRELSA